MSDNKENTGDWNTGDRNTGDWNTGDCNTGDWNTGDCNTGDCNTGDCNTGDCNTGDRNTGDRNTGDRNTGDWNTGDWNTGDWNTGHFCTQTEYKMFNKPCTKDQFFATKPNWLYFSLTTWVWASEMNAQEKKDHPLYETTNGYLKVFDYKEAAQNAWSKASEDEKRATFNLPNFDVEIFFEIFGIDVREEDKKCEPVLKNFSTHELLDEIKIRIQGGN